MRMNISDEKEEEDEEPRREEERKLPAIARRHRSRPRRPL